MPCKVREALIKSLTVETVWISFKVFDRRMLSPSSSEIVFSANSSGLSPVSGSLGVLDLEMLAAFVEVTPSADESVCLLD